VRETEASEIVLLGDLLLRMLDRRAKALNLRKAPGAAQSEYAAVEPGSGFADRSPSSRVLASRNQPRRPALDENSGGSSSPRLAVEHAERVKR
jgi:hypothetical protein